MSRYWPALLALVSPGLLATCRDSPSDPGTCATLEGTVVLATYLLPVAGADVILSELEHLTDPLQRSTTDDAGKYRIEQVPANKDRHIRVLHDDYRVQSQPLRVTEGRNIVDFVLQTDHPFKLRILVDGPSGGATAKIGALTLNTVGGRCAFEGLVVGDWYRILVEAPSYVSQVVDFHALIWSCFFGYCAPASEGFLTTNMTRA